MKQLPIVNSPTLTCTLPVSGKKIKYRPFVIKEQKALMLAQQSEDADAINETIADVILSCTGGTLVYEEAPTADISYFFLQLRIASVGPESRFSIQCKSCEHMVPVELDMSTINVDMSKSSNVVMITDSIGMELRYPTIKDAFDVDKYDPNERNTKMLISLITKIFDADSVYDVADYPDSVLEEWLMALNDEQVDHIQKFVDNIPELSHNLEFTCPQCSTKQSRLLEGLHTFFRIGNDSRQS